MQHFLVTGGAGFIGSNTVEKLVERDVKVTVLDDLFLGAEDNLSSVKDDIKFIEGSVLKQDKVKEAVDGVDVVFHLAARSSSPMHKENPAESARVNIEGFINVAEAAVDGDVEKIVYASTSSMYGTVNPPHTEDMDLEPTNLYTASKMSREMYARCYSYTDRIETTGLRFFSVFGPHEKGKDKYANVVTQFLWKMMDDEKPVIWGDGTQERDFVYVEDVARASIKAAETGEKLDGEIINIGRGDPITFNEVVEELNNALDKDIGPEKIENPRDKYVERHCAENEKAEKLLDWSPEYSFKKGLEKTVQYYQ